MYGIIKVAAIDCKDEEELCEEFNVYSLPTIKLFTELESDEGEVYLGDLDHASIQNAATSKMQSFISLLTKDNFNE